MNEEAIYKKITENGLVLSREDFKALIEKIDISKIRKDIESKYKLKLWDKKSPINGVKANTILKSKKYEIDSVYLIYVNNNLTYLQDHNPTIEGYVKMTKEEANEIGKKFIENKINEEINIDVYNNIFNTINKEGMND